MQLISKFREGLNIWRSQIATSKRKNIEYQLNMKPKQLSLVTIPDEIIMNQIYQIRNKKVMIDRDLAKLYGVSTKRLKETVRRNEERFPDDFMFEMSMEEFMTWKKSAGLSEADKTGLRYLPFCFTEQGVTMLSCVLRSKQAIEVNIKVIRIFTRLREFILSNKEVLLKLEQIEKSVAGHSEEIHLIFSALKKLIQQPSEKRKAIGYKS